MFDESDYAPIGMINSFLAGGDFCPHSADELSFVNSLHPYQD